jgi:rSAM-partnered protein
VRDERTRTTAPRSDGEPEWEAFARRSADAALEHVGSVTAPTAAAAHEALAPLVPDAAAVWLCPADEVARFDDRTLATEERP